MIQSRSVQLLITSVAYFPTDTPFIDWDSTFILGGFQASSSDQFLQKGTSELQNSKRVVRAFMGQSWWHIFRHLQPIGEEASVRSFRSPTQHGVKSLLMRSLLGWLNYWKSIAQHTTWMVFDKDYLSIGSPRPTRVVFASSAFLR